MKTTEQNNTQASQNYTNVLTFLPQDLEATFEAADSDRFLSLMKGWF